MNTIEFSHNYTKLPAGIKTAVLVAAEPVRLQEQTVKFILYDTNYGIGIGFYDTLGHKHHNGEDSDYLCLVLKSDSGAIFTTLRKDNSENREKYMILVDRGDKVGLCQEPRYGKYFQIIIKEG